MIPYLGSRGRTMKLRERWVDYLYRAATGTQNYRSSRTPIGLAIFGLFTALFVVLAIITDRMLGLPRPITGLTSRAAAYCPMAIGASLTAWTVFCFRTPQRRRDRPQRVAGHYATGDLLALRQ